MNKVEKLVKYKGEVCKIIGHYRMNDKILRIKTSKGTLIVHESTLDEPVN